MAKNFTLNTPVCKFFPFREMDYIGISDISEVALKDCAKTLGCIRDGEDRRIGHLTALDHIAKSLGFKGGWGGLKAAMPHLEKFKAENGLIKLSNFFARDYFVHQPTRPFSNWETIRKEERSYEESRYPLFNDLFTDYQQIAGRLFYCDSPKPKRIFLNHDITFDELVDAVFRNSVSPFYLIVGKYAASILFDDKTDYAAVAISHREWEQLKERGTSQDKYDYVHVLITDGFGKFSTSFHRSFYHIDYLIGDQFTDIDGEINFYPIFNRRNDREEEKVKSEINVQRKALMLIPEYWVDVIPYNDNLIFFRKPNGDFDFIFKNIRSCLPYGFSLTKFLSEDEFPWFNNYIYYHYEGFLDKDILVSHREYYKTLYSKDLPDVRKYISEIGDVLRDYLLKQGKYSPEIPQDLAYLYQPIRK